MKDSNLRKMIISCLMVITGLPAFANLLTVNGVVTDTDREPLIGATVMIKGRRVGTATDTDGAFTLKAEAKDVLVVSYLGYITK